MAVAGPPLDIIAHGAGVAGLPEGALAVLATAIGLPPAHLPGFRGAAARRRIARAARDSRSAAEMTQAVSTAMAGTPDAVTLAATDRRGPRGHGRVGTGIDRRRQPGGDCGPSPTRSVTARRAG